MQLVPEPAILDIDTPHGPARALVQLTGGAAGALLLGHGAGGSVSAPDLQSATREALERGWSVALVEQPYRVAGKRSTPRPPVLDAGWLAVVDALRDGPLGALPLVFGGRSSGARVACRTALAGGAVGALALAFPLQPPPRRNDDPAPSRLDELDAAGVPVLVVQGESDRFGMPPEGAGRTVAPIAGDHGLKKEHDKLRAAIGAWLAAL